MLAISCVHTSEDATCCDEMIHTCSYLYQVFLCCGNYRNRSVVTDHGRQGDELTAVANTGPDSGIFERGVDLVAVVYSITNFLFFLMKLY